MDEEEKDVLSSFIHLSSSSFFLKEVVGGSAGDVRLASSWCRIELQECVVKPVVKLHDCCLVPAPVAVIWRRKDCDYVPVVAPVVTFHHQLVRSRHERQPICVVKCLGNILTKCVARPTWRDPPAAPIIWIRPEQVAHWPFVRNLKMMRRKKGAKRN